MVPSACTCYLVRCWMCWRHQLVKKGKSLKKDFWISSISVGVLIPCCVSRQCSACFPPLKSKSTSCWENRLRLNENKNVATLKCITFCSEALFCKNNDLRALQAVNKRPHEFQSDLQNACSFHTGGNFRALTFVWDFGWLRDRLTHIPCSTLVCLLCLTILKRIRLFFLKLPASY